jgi:L-threonylcarbamoyladenylate synthase
VDAVKSMGADLSTHQSQPVTPDLLRRADLVYTMTDAHLDEVMELYPWAGRKVSRLDPDGDVADPIGSSDAVYRRVASRLSKVIQERLQELPL